MADLLERLRTALADRYEIESEIGRGGMAIVYLAQDLKHQRKVAIKVLHPELAATLGSERFLQEIEIVAGLNHPNILPLFDSGDSAGLLYYVMPYLAGESLRDRITREEQLAIDDALQVVREVADALGYAHSRGIVHRDIKPENLLLASGHTLVADFGIARAISDAGGDRLTGTGLSIGTPTYMSPEQAGGSTSLDARSDIYSLGCVLYEMLAGEPPHTGATPQVVLAKKAFESVRPIKTIRETVPDAVDAAIAKALATVPADRFATAQHFTAALDVTAAPGSADTEPGPKEPERNRRLRPAMIVGAALLAVIGIVGWQLLENDPIDITLSNPRQVTFGPEIEFEPDISDDGGRVAYTSGFGLAMRVMVKSLSDPVGGQPIPLAASLGGHQRHPRYGTKNRVLFSQYDIGANWSSLDGGAGLYYVSETGGTATKILPRWAHGPAWAPDEARVVYAVRDSIMSTGLDGADPRLLALVPFPGPNHSLSWSPDGQWIAFVNGNSWFVESGVLGNVAPSSIWVVRANGGEPVRVTGSGELNMSPAWLPDSQHLLYVSDRERRRDVFAVRVGEGGAESEPRRLGIADAHSLSVSADGTTLAYSKFLFSRNIRSYPIQDAAPVSISAGTRVTSGDQVIETLSLTRGGRSLVFDSNRNGNQDIFVQNLGGGPSVQVTADSSDEFGGVLSPDGTELTYFAIRDGFRAVFVKPTSLGPETRLSPDAGGVDFRFPDWSPDGLKIVFEGRGGPWVVSRDSIGAEWSDPVSVGVYGLRPVWMPDGQAIMVSFGGALWKVSMDGRFWRLFQSVPDSTNREEIRTVFRAVLTTDGDAIVLSARTWTDAEAVWSIPVTTGQPCRLEDDGRRICQEDVALPAPRLVVEFDSPSEIHFSEGIAASADRVFLAIGEYVSDVWVTDLDW